MKTSTKKIFFLPFVLIFTVSLAFSYSRGKQDLIQADSFIYDNLTALGMESGKLFLCDQTPLSVNEISTYLNSIDYENLSEAGKAAYDEIISEFNAPELATKSDIFRFGTRPEINLEGYYKTNQDIDWIYNYQDKKPFIKFPVFINAGDFVSMETDLTFGKNKGEKIKPSDYINIPFGVPQMDINFPSYGYFSTGYDFTEKTHLNVQLGMGPQSLGRSATGSMILSEHFTGASFFNLEIFSPNIKYNMNVTQFNVDKYMYSHRIDFRFLQKITFLAQESMLVYAPIELRFLNPLTIFHGYTPWLDYTPAFDYYESNTCAYMCFALSYSPVKYLRLYGIFAQDQFQTKYERDNWPNDTTPNGIGFQLGAESFIPVGKGYIHSWLEGSYADPFLYIKENPNWSLLRTYRENMGAQAIFYEWVGSPFGPDTISAELNLSYSVPQKWELALSYLFLAKGEYSGSKIFTPELGWGGFDTVPGENSDGTPDVGNWPYPDKDKEGGLSEAKRRQFLITPSGLPEFVNRISLFGSWSPLSYVTINCQTGYVYIMNFNNQSGTNKSGFEFTLSLNIKLPDFVRF